MSDRSATHQPATNHWALAFGVICMIMVANLQHGWTLFVNPLDSKYHWGAQPSTHANRYRCSILQVQSLALAPARFTALA
jgi:hypothetical protein